jgi:general secretion pathway protein K
MMAWRPRDTNPLANERGVALVITLVIVTLVAVVVLDVNYLMRVDVHAAANFRDGIRSYYLAKSGVNLTRELFSRNLQEFEELKNTLLMGGTHTLPIGDGSVTIRVVDETGKINVNALTLETVPAQTTASAQTQQQPNDPPPNPWIQITQDLFQRLGIDPGLVGAMIDWIDIDDIPTGSGGGESSYYRGLEKPYAARNGPLETIGEMRLLRGFTEEVWLKLGAKRIGGIVDPATNLYLTVLPLPQEGGWRVNLNTAPILILKSLTREVGRFAEAIVQRRTQARIDKITDLQQLGISGEAFEEFQRLGTVTSLYYSVEARGTVGEIEKYITALIKTGGEQESQMLYWREL